MRTREKLIQVRVTKAEREIIEHNAAKLNMQVAPYIRMVAQNPTIIQNNYAAIQEHTRQIGRITNSINRLIYTIDLNNDYLPKEIDGIADYIEKIWETENKLLAEVQNQWIKDFKHNRKQEKKSK